jgi:hypothetical protein
MKTKARLESALVRLIYASFDAGAHRVRYLND